MALSFNNNIPQNITFNNQDVTKVVYNNNIVWQKQSGSGTLTVSPNGYDSDRTKWKSATNIENAYADTESTTYARISLVTGGMANTYVYFTFDLSSIPQNATIKSVSCSVRCSVSNANTARIAQKEIQLFTGTTAKGTATIMPTTDSVVELDTGTWTRQEINDLSLRFFVQRGYSGGNNNYEILAHGADLTIEYE